MVYLIEDDKSIMRGFELFLRSADMEYKSFETATSFLDENSLQVNDILVLDMNLPGMMGHELLKSLHEMNIYVPTIVITANDDEDNRQVCREYGVKAYLRKPVDGEALIDIIKFHRGSRIDIIE